MPHYSVTIIKHSKSQPIGIGLANDPIHGLLISSIASEGALSGTCLKQGMKLLTINSIEVSNLSSKDAVKILKDIEGKLTLCAETCDDNTLLIPTFVSDDITFDSNKHYRRPDGVIMHGMMSHDINNAMPTIFKEADVPWNTYSSIYKLIESDLIPPAAALKIHEVTLDREFGSYVTTQMITGGMIGFGTESRHEKKFFEMTLKSANLERNVDLKAMDVTIRVNAMLAKYNLTATVALETAALGQHSTRAHKMYDKFDIVGLQFHRIE